MPQSALVVDDSTMSRKLLLKALPSSWDAEIRQASGGEEALAILRDQDVDVLFLDLTMPGLDGFGVLQAIREEDLSCIPIVVSADVQERAISRASELGALAFIKKPVNGEAVAQALSELGLL